MNFTIKEKRDDWIKKKNMKVFNLYNEKWAVREIDILIDSPVSYREATQQVKHMKTERVKIPVIGISDLIKMKEAGGRAQDLADIRYLKRLLQNEKKRF
jgi:hypothetical protein